MDFGQKPLSHPLMVEAIEDLFVPVLIYNNKPEDEATLQAFSEPAWNNPVVRYLNGNGDDIIERRDGVWETRDMAARMISCLQRAGRQVPEYLRLMSREATECGTATFAMHCYWEGEGHLGKLSGVLSTRSAWVGEKEVVEVTFDPTVIDYAQLVGKAKQMECASTVFARTEEQFETASDLVGADAILAETGFAPRDAKTSDQKYYLRNSMMRHLPLTELQATKINAALGEKIDIAAARVWLSPRQLQLLSTIERVQSKDPDAMKSFIFPGAAGQLPEYDARLRERLASFGGN